MGVETRRDREDTNGVTLCARRRISLANSNQEQEPVMVTCKTLHASARRRSRMALARSLKPLGFFAGRWTGHQRCIEPVLSRSSSRTRNVAQDLAGPVRER